MIKTKHIPLLKKCISYASVLIVGYALSLVVHDFYDNSFDYVLAAIILFFSLVAVNSGIRR